MYSWSTLLEPSHHAVRKPNYPMWGDHRERLYVGVLAASLAEMPAYIQPQLLDMYISPLSQPLALGSPSAIMSSQLKP